MCVYMYVCTFMCWSLSFLLVKVVMAYPEGVWSHGGSDGRVSISMVLHSMLATGQTLPERLVQLVESIEKVEEPPATASVQQRNGPSQKEAAKNGPVSKKLVEKEMESLRQEAVSKEIDLVEVDLGGTSEAQPMGKGPTEDALAGMDQELPLLRQSPVLLSDPPEEEKAVPARPMMQWSTSSFPNGSLPRPVPSGPPSLVAGAGVLGASLSPVSASGSPQERLHRSLSLQPLLGTSPQHHHHPITVRIGMAEGDGQGAAGEAGDVVAVSLKKDKKRKGKRSKNRSSGPGIHVYMASSFRPLGGEGLGS